MEDRKLFITAITSAIILILTSFWFLYPEIEGKGNFYSGEEKIAEINLEIADSDKERQVGLMNRTFLPENHGMLFIYSDEDERTFWMKNTYIPLDMIFIDSKNNIVDIKKAFPEPDTPDSELRTYTGEEPAQYVLEVNQNFTDKEGIEIGDHFYFNRSNKQK